MIARRPEPRVILAGVPVHLMDADAAVDTITRRSLGTVGAPLAVASINLDHIHHFGGAARPARLTDRRVEWLNLLDGAPLAAQTRRLTGKDWPRLAGSDLIASILDRAERDGARVGVVGGTEPVLEALRGKLSESRPALRLAGTWSPDRAEIVDDASARTLAARIQDAGTDILLVCLGKPRQELWIERYGHLTGARVLLAFGAVVDFLAGTVERAPRIVAEHGLEWAWRLALEPRRLARRYLLDGPPAYLAVRRDSRHDEPRAEVDA